MKKYTPEQEEKITPYTNLPVVGTKVPIDVHYRKKRLPLIRVTLCMPDEMIMSIPVFEGEDMENKIKKFVGNWFKVTKDDPSAFNHFVTNQKCPKCGGELRSKILQKGCAIWCTNHPSCNYIEHGDSMKARQLMAEKYGIEWKLVNKTGTKTIVSSNRNKT